MVAIDGAQVKGQEKSAQGVTGQRRRDQETSVKGNRREKKVTSQTVNPKYQWTTSWSCKRHHHHQRLLQCLGQVWCWYWNHQARRRLEKSLQTLQSLWKQSELYHSQTQSKSQYQCQQSACCSHWPNWTQR